jgi:endonuclease YncB( thermonuclease family)
MDGIPQGVRKTVRLCPGMDGQRFAPGNIRTSTLRGGRIPQGARDGGVVCLWKVLRASLLITVISFLCIHQAAAGAACSTEHFDEVLQLRYIHDGDTVHLKDGKKIRLIGINTPELARENKSAEPFADEARNALAALFDKDKSIALVYGKDKKDRYGRILAHAFTVDGKNIQALLLSQGYARAITIPPNTEFSSCYLEMERLARCNKKGIWNNTKILDANNLKGRQSGFKLVKGRVTGINSNDKGIWISLDDTLTIGIRSENRSLFDMKTLNNYLNHVVIVRGWLNKRNTPTPYYLRLRHPRSIELFADFSCP